MIRLDHFGERADRDDLSVCERGNPIALDFQAIEIVCNHKYCEIERLLQGLDQRIEVAGRNRVQPRRRLVKKQDFRI